MGDALTDTEVESLICYCAGDDSEGCPAHGEGDWVEVPAAELLDKVARIVAVHTSAAVKQAQADERERIAQAIEAQESCGVRDRGHDGCYVADSLRIAQNDWLAVRTSSLRIARNDWLAARTSAAVKQAEEDSRAWRETAVSAHQRLAAVRDLCHGDYANSKHVSGYSVVRVNDVLAVLDDGGADL